jgi:hydroxymethylbilane synthase
MSKSLRIGTRDSQLAVWQATLVQTLLHQSGISSELVFIKSDGDINTTTPLYALGVQGIFTKELDVALLNNRIDIAVHSMKDMPVQLANGIQQAAVLKRGSYKDVFVYKNDGDLKRIGFFNGEWSTDILQQEEVSTRNSFTIHNLPLTIATSSVRRMAQWWNKYPYHKIEDLRGNVNTRLRKLKESNWHGAIFAAAGLERINLRPRNSIDLDWMLPAPAQGAIMVVCREDDEYPFESCRSLNDEETALCTKTERDFLSGLMGGCSTPISALATIHNGKIRFRGNILSPDGTKKVDVEKTVALNEADNLGGAAAELLLNSGGKEIAEIVRNAKV